MKLATLFTLLVAIIFGAHSLDGGEVSNATSVETLKLVSLDDLPEGKLRIRFVVAPPPTLASGEPRGPIRVVKASTDFMEFRGKSELSFSSKELPHIKAETKYTWNYLMVELQLDGQDDLIWFLNRYDYMKMIWAKPFETEEEAQSATLVLPILLNAEGEPVSISQAWDERFGIK